MKITEYLCHGLWYRSRNTAKVVDEGEGELLPIVSLQTGPEKKRPEITRHSY